MFSSSLLKVSTRRIGGVVAVRFHVCIWLVVSITPSVLADDTLSRELFLQQYVPHAKLLEEAYTNIYVKYHFLDDGGKGKASGWYLNGKYNRRNSFVEGESVLVDTQTKQEIYRNKTKSIACVNNLYSFELYPSEDGQYVLQKLDMHNEANKPDLSMLSVPYADVDRKKSYLEIAQDETTRIISFEDRLWQGKTRKELKTGFTRIHPPTKERLNQIVDYYFSPEDGWICYGKRNYLKEGSKHQWSEQRYYYETKNTEQLPALKRLESWSVDTRDLKNTRASRITEIDAFRRSPTPFPDSDFRLSAFGLPEPKGVPQPAVPRTWLWLIAAAAGAGLLAILFAWLKRRRVAATQAKAEVVTRSRGLR